ncbi:hypothetical protein N657DRAFT_638071 [Parathielavia appendiculata]|uniref:Uncharacterized protein n=1 Tax=Parathielavia appendiculata TaxID=2587402 RepID=A0AAN6TPR6_9PEZI|nr:hypothetical protein N657DRAFT_638071 [Parathielavia appendiculata]
MEWIPPKVLVGLFCLVGCFSLANFQFPIQRKQLEHALASQHEYNANPHWTPPSSTSKYRRQERHRTQSRPLSNTPSTGLPIPTAYCSTLPHPATLKYSSTASTSSCDASTLADVAMAATAGQRQDRIKEKGDGGNRRGHDVVQAAPSNCLYTCFSISSNAAATITLDASHACLKSLMKLGPYFLVTHDPSPPLAL